MLNQGGRQQQQHGEKEAPNSCGGGSGGGGSTASQLSYPKTKSQATTSGQDYEVALCSLFFLRALRVSSDFFLAGNYEPAGKFDDVVLFYRLNGDPDPAVYRAIFLQAKHKDGTRNTLTFTELQEYLQSFTQIKHHWEQPLVIDGRQIILKEVFLIHYTNTGCVVDRIASDVADLPDLQKFLNTGGRVMRIRQAPEVELPQGEDTSNFLGKLLLCTQQMSVKTTDKFLLDEMCKLLGLESCHVGSELTSELKSVVKAWWSDRGRGTFLTANSEEWKGILQMQMTRLNADTLAVDSRMNLAFTAAALQQLDVVSHRTKVAWIPVSDTHQASVMRVRLLRARSESLVLGAKYLDSHRAEVEALWGKSVCQTLATDLTDYPRWEESQLLQRLQEAAEMDARRHLVVVATEKPPSEGWNIVEPLETWYALDTPTQHRLLSVKVQLQGVTDVEVRDVVGFILSDVMTDKVIKSLSVSEPAIRLGQAMTTPLDYYVPRCLERTPSRTFTYQSLENTTTLLFLYNYWSYSFPVKVKKLKQSDLEKTNKIEGLIILYAEASDSEIRNMCSKFRVKGVKGWAEREGLTEEVTEFIPLTWICEENVVVVEGLPGVGKSSFVTQMCSVAKKEFPECWVLRVDMARYTEYLEGADFASPSDVMEFLLKAIHKDLGYLERHLLEHALRVTGNVLLFLDAFDEISPDYTAQCCRLLKGIAKGVRYRKMVVTTRPVTTKDVEEALETKAFTLPLFSREEQTLFFTNFSVASGKFIDKEAITSFQQIAGDVIEIPLLCKMSADVLMNNQDQSVFEYKDPWRRVFLYHLFVEQTIKNHIAEKLDLKDPRPAVRRLLESNTTQHLCNLHGLAVRKLMPDTELANLYDGVPEEKFGLVVNTGESVDFEHRTFAEFFLGCWLSDNWRHCPQQLLQDGFQFVVATLSWSLFQSFPLHLAVARGDAEAVRKELLLSSAGTTDSGGRSALHVAAMTPGCSREILEMLVASGGDLNREDAILARPAVNYAEVARNWDFLEVMAEKSARLENLNFLNNQKAAEEVLIQAIQRDLANFTNCVLKLNNLLLRVRVGDNRNTLLHIAALNNSTGVLDVLIQNGFEINVQNRSGDTALNFAAEKGHLAVTELLIERGADAEVKDDKGNTAIMGAARDGKLEIVKFLIERGVDTKVKNKSGNTAIILAARDGNLEIVKFLMESGVDANVKNNEGNTAIILAAWRGKLEIVKLLIDCGVDAEVKNNDGDTVIILATRWGNFEIVKLLIESGVDAGVKDNNGDTVIMWAAREGYLEIVKLLIESGVDAKVKNNNGTTSIMMAAREGNLEIVKFLIESGVDAKVRNNNGETSIMWAAEGGNFEIVKLLIESGVDANVKNNNCDTAILWAARKMNWEIVKYLVESGVDANVKDNNGNTVILWAGREGNLEIVKFLIESGVDANVKNNKGDTLIMRAALGGILEIVKFLIESGVDANVKDNNGNTVIMWAAWGGNLEIVKFLIESGVDANVKNNNCDTAILWAARKRNLEIIKFLIESGVDSEVKNKYGETALSLAEMAGHWDVVNLLIEKGVKQ